MGVPYIEDEMFVWVQHMAVVAQNAAAVCIVLGTVVAQSAAAVMDTLAAALEAAEVGVELLMKQACVYVNSQRHMYNVDRWNTHTLNCRNGSRICCRSAWLRWKSRRLQTL